MPTFSERLKHAWNAFTGRDPTPVYNIGPGYYTRPDRPRLRPGNERTIVTSVINRIAIDCAAVKIEHVKLDENGRYKEPIRSGLNNCLTVEANIDQTGRQLVQDIVMSMCDEGCVAVVPVKTKTNPKITDGFIINELRVGKIVEWYPEWVKVELYNDEKGRKEQITIPKRICAIIENPLYAVMNEPNSMMRRLISVLAHLDAVDQQASSGKLDLIIQLPYVIKTEEKRRQAEIRRQDMESQLASSKYGVAYAEASEKVTQLNRPLENNLLNQVTYFTQMLFGQLGLTEAVFNGTASEEEMLNYYNRTIEPILSAITNEFKRKFLSKTARSQHQSIYFVRDPFKLAPVNQIAEIADKFTRNEILSSNEIRAIVGYKPVEDERADQLRNKNLNEDKEAEPAPVVSYGPNSEPETN